MDIFWGELSDISAHTATLAMWGEALTMEVTLEHSMFLYISVVQALFVYVCMSSIKCAVLLFSNFIKLFLDTLNHKRVF